MLPWCLDDCAFLAEREEDIETVMQWALFDQDARQQICADFQNRFGSARDCAGDIAGHIRQLVAQPVSTQ